MYRNTCHWMAFSALSFALFSGGTSTATAHCKDCNGYKGAIPSQVSFIPRGLYLSVFGGGGGISNTRTTQSGTAFFPEATVGPLAIDGKGNVNSHNTWFAGANLGYAWKNQGWCITPAVELEGFYLHTTLDDTLDARHTALPEHGFDDSFPLSSAVFLVNTVFSSNVFFPQAHLYLGGGIGGAVLSISGAESLQVRPPELGVDHFSAERDAQTSTFAAQLKAGLSYSFTDCFSVFAEYRLLYLGPNHFVFGSTVATGHVPTSPWNINFDGSYYNLGAVGIQFSV